MTDETRAREEGWLDRVLSEVGDCPACGSKISGMTAAREAMLAFSQSAAREARAEAVKEVREALERISNLTPLPVGVGARTGQLLLYDARKIARDALALLAKDYPA